MQLHTISVAHPIVLTLHRNKCRGQNWENYKGGEGNLTRIYTPDLILIRWKPGTMQPSTSLDLHKLLQVSAYIHKPAHHNGGINNRYGKVITIAPYTSPLLEHPSGLLILP